MRNPFVRRFGNDSQAKTWKKESSNEDPDEGFGSFFSRAIAATKKEIAPAKKASYLLARKSLVPSTKPSPLPLIPLEAKSRNSGLPSPKPSPTLTHSHPPSSSLIPSDNTTLQTNNYLYNTTTIRLPSSRSPFFLDSHPHFPLRAGGVGNQRQDGVRKRRQTST